MTPELVQDAGQRIAKHCKDLAAAGRFIRFDAAATTSAILAATLKPHLPPAEWDTACLLLASLLNSHGSLHPMRRTVTDTVTEKASGGAG